MAARLLPALTADNVAPERKRMVAELQAGRPPVPSWTPLRPRNTDDAFRLLDVLRDAVQPLPFAAIYHERFDELELDVALLGALGDPRQVRPLSARRFGTGAEPVPLCGGHAELTLRGYAEQVLQTLPPSPEPRVLPATAGRGEPSMAAIVQSLCDAVGLDVAIRVDPRLVAGAATGDRTVYLADRRFGLREARRLAVHEVLGHLVSAANGRAQPLRVLEWGTAGAFCDQEGLALYLEACHGLLDGDRLRTLAARVVAADMVHGGAAFAETARRLYRDDGFGAEQAIAIAERAYRGGGVARDVSYLLGLIRVAAAVRSGEATIDELCSGRLSIAALPMLRRMRPLGAARGPCFRPHILPDIGVPVDGVAPAGVQLPAVYSAIAVSP